MAALGESRETHPSNLAKLANFANWVEKRTPFEIPDPNHNSSQFQVAVFFLMG